MKERPILFNAPMVCAVDDGMKRQTRRAVDERWQRFDECCLMPESLEIERGAFMDFPGRTEASFVFHNGIPIRDGEWQPVICPHSEPGDRLWVRETYFAYGRWETRFSAKKGRDEWHFIDMTLECDRTYQHAAANPDVPVVSHRASAFPGWWKRPAIFMPRAACRLVLEITGVRVERLNSISDDDVDAECFGGDYPENVLPEIFPRRDGGWGHLSMQECFARLWESINGPGSWEANPWVWVVEFERVGAKDRS